MAAIAIIRTMPIWQYMSLEKLRAIIADVFATDRLENWIAKMKAANIPVGYLRTVEEGFNAPEVRDRARLSRIPHPTAGTVPNIETPLNMSLTPTIDPVAAAKEAGKIAGVHAFSVDDGRKRIAQGFRFLTVMAETRLIRAGATASLQALRG